MRSIASDILTQLAKRTGIKVRLSIWITARNRTTGLPETIGIWNGDDTVVLNIGGQDRIYYGAGGLLDFDELKQEKGIVIHRLVGRFSAISAEIETALREYNSKFARVECHMIFYNPETDNVIASPYRFFKGWIDTAPIKTPAKGGQGVATINMVGHARILTRLISIKRSDANQRKRDTNDRFFENVSVTGTIITPWGQAGVASASPGASVNTGPSWQGII